MLSAPDSFTLHLPGVVLPVLRKSPDGLFCFEARYVTDGYDDVVVRRDVAGLLEWRMSLKTLKPKLATLSTSRIKVLDTKAGATERIRGRSWMTTRQRIALAHGYRCAGCGCVWASHRDQIDHKIPLEQGGSNDDSNLQPLCDDCHKGKTAEQARRGARW